MNYIRNRDCSCARCRAHNLMGAAVLITVGVLALLDIYHIAPFDRTFPILFLVICGVLLVARSGSTEGHVNPPWYNAQIPPQNPQQWTGQGTSPPAQQNPPANPYDPQVKP